ncbi:MAG TPA: alpha/beta fold hydrolase [Longimicrobiales bacterium]|nr:alpha/beta fold hydrolase [Longimicrobiales bacterium]
MTSLVFVAVGVAAAGGLYALDRVANAVVRPVPRLPTRGVLDAGVDHEDLTIASGHHTLAAWLLHPRGARERPASAGRPLFLLTHGWGASYGTVLLLAEPLVGAGHDVLLFDMRGHGRNAPLPYVTVRQLRDDVIAAVGYATERFPGRPLVLVGHSFGGAASVLAAAEGARVAGLVLVATPSDVVCITAEYLTAKGMPGALMAALLRPFWWWRLGGTFVPHTPERRIREVDVPVLIIQPEHDERVHRRHAERLAAAAGIPYHLIPNREHTDVLSDETTVRLVTELAERVGVGQGQSDVTIAP